MLSNQTREIQTHMGNFKITSFSQSINREHFSWKSTNKGDDNRTRINHSRWNQKNRICINGHVKKTNQNIYPVPSQKSFRLLLVVIRISNVNVRISNKFNILGLQQSIQKRNNKLINHQHNYKVHEAHHDKHFYTRFTARWRNTLDPYQNIL